MITWDFHEHLFFILVYFSLAHESGFFWVGTEAGKALGVKEEKLGKGWKKGIFCARLKRKFRITLGRFRPIS